MKKVVQLTAKEAIVLQQAQEEEVGDARGLADQLSMSYSSFMAVVQKLKRKGLITINNGLGELWVKLTRKGQRLMNQVWPESSAGFSAA